MRVHVNDDGLAAGRFGKMKRGVYFYNIGRGATVVQGDLVAALASGQVGAAYLDVTTPEPLPSDDALWTAPNCWITLIVRARSLPVIVTLSTLIEPSVGTLVTYGVTLASPSGTAILTTYSPPFFCNAASLVASVD